MNAGSPIVVGVDGSPSSLDAARWAARAARLHRVPLRIVCAVGGAMPLLGHTGLGRARTERLERLAEQCLSAAATAAAEENPPSVETVVLHGNSRPELIKQSREARIVVVGSQGHSELRAGIVGSTASALAGHGVCPVAVIHALPAGWTAGSVGTVVVGVDGSEHSQDAIAFAFAEASARGCALTAVHVWSDFAVTTMFEDPGVLPWEDLERAEAAVLAESLAGWQEQYPDVEVTRVVRRDRPIPTFHEFAAGAEMLVLGSRGRGGFTGMLLGSVSSAVAQAARLPVIVVRGAG
jgi:nucleotide-binding universal stress UspA family protein